MFLGFLRRRHDAEIFVCENSGVIEAAPRAVTSLLSSSCEKGSVYRGGTEVGGYA